MPASFVSTLPKALRQAWPTVTAAVRQGLSANAIQRTLRAVGIGVRRQTLLDGVRLLREGFQKQATIRLLDNRIRPPLSFIPQALTRIRRRFAYTLRVTLTQFGQQTTRFFTLSTDQHLTADEAVLEAINIIEQDDTNYSSDAAVQDVQLTSILKEGPLGTL